jgi:tetratricopeptide (TPR) repeat protein
MKLVRLVLLVNVGWGIINLLPVLPLDGGNVLAAALGPRRVFATAVVSGVVATAVALVGLRFGMLFVVMLFGFAAFNAFGQARVARQGEVDRREGLEDRLSEAKAALARGDLESAYVLADDVVRRAQTAPVRNGGWTALAWVHVARGEGALAREALAHVEPRGAVDPYTWAAVEDAAGMQDRARAILVEARRQGFVTADATKLLVDLLARAGRLEEAVEVTHEDASILDPEEVRAVYRAALESGAPRAAARLANRLFELHGGAHDALDEARALAAAGDVTAALAALAHAIQLGVDRAAVRVDPAFASLAEDDRFERIVAS